MNNVTTILQTVGIICMICSIATMIYAIKSPKRNTIAPIICGTISIICLATSIHISHEYKKPVTRTEYKIEAISVESHRSLLGDNQLIRILYITPEHEQKQAIIHKDQIIAGDKDVFVTNNSWLTPDKLQLTKKSLEKIGLYDIDDK